MVINQNKWQTLLYAILTFFVAAGFVSFAVLDFRQFSHNYNFWLDNSVIYWILRAVCFVLSFLTVAGDIYLFREMLSKKPLVEICDEYFFDNSSIISLGKIAWDDIEIAYAKGGFLNIKLKNPDIYFKKKNSLQMLMIKGNLRLGYGHACISPQRLRKNSEKFIEEFQKRIKIEQ